MQTTALFQTIAETSVRTAHQRLLNYVQAELEWRLCAALLAQSLSASRAIVRDALAFLENPFRHPAVQAEWARIVDEFRIGLVTETIFANNHWQGQPRDSLGRWVDANGGGLDERHKIARGTRAVRRALRHKADVPKAMYRRGLGEIGFEWGRPRSPLDDWRDGYGISHIVAKHGRVAALRLPVVIAKGKLYPHESNPQKRYLVYGNTLAVLERHNKKSAYVVTGYDDPKRISYLEGR